MLIVLDTTVIFQALYSNVGASHFILNLVRRQKVHIALSHKVFLEYEAVLNRKSSLKETGLSSKNVADVLTFLAYVGRSFDTHFLFRPNLKDEGDNMFVELAVACDARYLVTSNTRDFRSHELIFDSFKLATPAEFVQTWRSSHEG